MEISRKTRFKALGYTLMACGVVNLIRYWDTPGEPMTIFIICLMAAGLVMLYFAYDMDKESTSSYKPPQRGSETHKAFLLVTYNECIKNEVTTTYEKEIFKRGIRMAENDMCPIKVEDWVEATIKQWRKLI